MRYLYVCFLLFFFGSSAMAQQVFPVLPAVAVQGRTINVPYSFKGITINSGNIYTLQLSDERGSFDNPTDLDTLTSTVDSGVFISVIPNDQSSGANYRVRVLSSNPAQMSFPNNNNIVILNKYEASRNDSLEVNWNLRFGGTGTDIPYSGFQTSDKGYIMAGISYSGANGDKTQASQGDADYWVVKTDSIGNKQWDYRYGGSNTDFCYKILSTRDGGYLLGGYSSSWISGDKSQKSQGQTDFWIVKIDSVGKKQWDKRYGGSDYDDLRDIVLTPEGGYLLAGSSLSNISGDKSQNSKGGGDYWIVKIDSVGNKVWDKTYGGSNSDALTSIIWTHDNNYILGGFTYSSNSGDMSQNSRGNTDYWVVKIDNNGNKIWDKRFGGTEYDQLFSAILTNDHAYILTGRSNSGSGGDKSQATRGDFDYWVIKIDSNGSKIWDKRFGGKDEEQLYGVIQTTDNGYIIGGYSASDTTGDKTQKSMGSYDFWIVKIDSIGNKIWDRDFGGSGVDEMHAMQITSDGGLSLFGRSNSPISGDKSQSSQGTEDFWVIKMGYPNISSFVVNNDTQCFVDHHFDFIYKGQIGTHFLWNFGEGANDTSTAINPTKIYSAPGNYTMKLIVTDSFNHTDSSSASMLVIQSPHSSFTVNDTIQNIIANSFVFTNNSNNAQIYLWNYNSSFKDTSIVANPTKTYNYNGKLLVSLIVTDTNTGCKDSSSLYVYVLDQQVYTVLPNPILQNEIARVPFSFDTIMDSTNIYLLQMSNEEGDFTNAVFLDTIKSSQSTGIFKTVIPKSQLSGAGYRFRVISSNPVLISKTSNENIIICNQSNVKTDTIYKQWDKRFGGSAGDYLTAFQETRDNGFILCGHSSSGISGDKSQNSRGGEDYWIVKIDENGNKQWDKRFGGTDYDYATSIKQTKDGGYIIGGNSSSDNSGDKTQKSWNVNNADCWIIKIDSAGNKQWDKRYGTVNSDLMGDINETSDGGYIIGGISTLGLSGNSSIYSKGNTDYWIIKIDSAGEVQWNNGYGGNYNEILRKVKQTKDGGYILGGYSYSSKGGDVSQNAKGFPYYWIVKIDIYGKKQWDQSYGGGDYDYFSSLDQTDDNGYILGGYSTSGKYLDKSDSTFGSADYWVVKIDSVGKKQWDKSYGGDQKDNLFDVKQTVDKGYILGGYSYSSNTGNKKMKNKSNNKSDYWIIKIDSSGKYINEWDLGGTGYDDMAALLQTSNGGFAFAGTIDSYNDSDVSQTSHGYEDYWVYKVILANGATFSIDLDSQCLIGNKYSFSLVSKNAGYTYKWNFGETAIDTSTLKYPIKTYSDTGTYTVILEATDSFGNIETYKKKVFVRNGKSPVDSFDINNSSQCFNSNSFVLTNNTTGANSYQWSFGQSKYDTSSVTNPTKIYSTSGVYTISLLAISGSCKSLLKKMVNVKPSPTAAFAKMQNNGLTNFTFTNYSTGYSKYIWNFGTSSTDTSTKMNPAKTYTNSGFYTVFLIVSNDSNCSDTASKNISVFPQIYNVLPNPAVAGNNIAIPYYFKGINIQAGNSFTVQLSDKNGDFKNATVINSTKTTIDSGVIVAKIPFGQDPGAAYRIRILSTNVNDTTLANNENIVIVSNYNATRKDSVYKEWDQNFSTADNNNVNCIQQIQDKGYMYANYQDKGTGFDIVRTDSNGQYQWDKNITGIYNSGIQLKKLKQTSDGGFVLGGQKDNNTYTDYYIIKTDSQGKKEWSMYYGGNGEEHFTDIQPTSDGGYILGGTAYSYKGQDDYWIVKIDRQGTIEWNRRFGGTSYDYLKSLLQTNDGGYILAGNSSSGATGDKTQANQGGYDYWVLKIDKYGNKLWDKTFGGDKNDFLNSLTQTHDLGYLLGGYSESGISGDKTQASQGSSDGWVVKINKNGVKQWDKRFGGTNDEEFSSIKQTADLGYILGGTSNSNKGGDKSQNSWANGYDDYWVVKVDSSGLKQWDKRYGGTLDERLFSLQQTSNGGYILGGGSLSDKNGDKSSAAKYGKNQSWIVKLGFKDTTSFGVNNITQCIKVNSFKFTVNATFDSVFWNFGESATDTSSLKTPNKTYNKPGKYLVSVFVANKNGFSANSSQYVYVSDNLYKSINATICSGEKYMFGGKQLTQAGLYYDTIINIKSCDSIITLNLNVLSKTNYTVYDTSCIGGVYIFGGKQLTVSGVYNDTLKNYIGCDSIVLLNLYFKNRIFNSFSDASCVGQKYIFGGKQLTATGIYYDTLKNYIGCDSVVKLNFTVKQSSQILINSSICAGDSFLLGNQFLKVQGKYYDTLLNAQSCDSIIELTLNINPLPVVQITSWDGVMFTSSAALSYQWYLNGSAISGANSQTYKPISNGSYTVEVKDTNNCKNISTPYILSNLSIQGVMEEKVSVSPNPTKGVININIPTGKKVGNIYITDLNGKMIKKIPQSILSIDISELAQSIFLLHIDDQVIKIVRE